MDSVEAEERFRKKLAKLAALSPEKKRAHARQISAREATFVDQHARMSRDIADRRAFSEEAAGDENWNHDQPL